MIKRPTEYSEKAINSKYNDKAFSVEELNRIFDKLDELSETYPFASENIKMVFLLGQRQEEVFKLKKKILNFIIHRSKYRRMTDLLKISMERYNSEKVLQREEIKVRLNLLLNR